MRHVMVKSSFGLFALIEGDDGALATSWVDAAVRAELKRSTLDRSLHRKLAARLQKYFVGDRVDFSDVPLPHTTPFQRRCWEACRRIPRGVTISYAQLAARAGSPSAFRAAGQAMRANRLPVIVPCHRVIASDGSLHGFAGSVDSDGRELRIKRSLLELEGVSVDQAASRLPIRERRRTRRLVHA